MWIAARDTRRLLQCLDEKLFRGYLRFAQTKTSSSLVPFVPTAWTAAFRWEETSPPRMKPQDRRIGLHHITTDNKTSGGPKIILLTLPNCLGTKTLTSATQGGQMQHGQHNAQVKARSLTGKTFHAAEPPKLLEATGAATLFNLATQNLLGAPLISSNCRFGKH